MTRARLVTLAALAALLTPGCSILVDGALAGRGSGMDAGRPDVDGGAELDGGDTSDPCARFPDGTRCAIDGIAESLVCRRGRCELSICGDELVDDREDEECDDGNDVDGDGCDIDCTPSCAAASDCDDGRLCNGAETCSAASTCTAGTMAADGTACTIEGGASGSCRAGVCASADCGNGALDSGEECDDGNASGGDGCEADCTFTCETNEDCDDGDVCTGMEACDAAAHTCMPGLGMMCTAMMCADVRCDPVAGCVYDTSSFDTDRDGHFVTSCGGDDCDDRDASVFPGAAEQCDSIDHDCDGNPAPPMTPTWYADCDGDEFARTGAQSVVACTMPTSRPSSCATGLPSRWTLRAPITGAVDCNDTNSLARPGQTSFYVSPHDGRGNYDYDCDGVETLQYPNAYLLTPPSCVSARGVCLGATQWRTTVPACGETGTLSRCVASGTMCVRSSATERAACR